MKVFIGWDPKEREAWQVARLSIQTHASIDVEFIPISKDLDGYQRPTRTIDGRLWDDLSHAPMSTGHAIARFFVPYVCQYQGWAVFMDGDVLVRRDIAKLFALADSRYAVQVVKHNYRPEGVIKKDGAEQTAYGRKNWSSVMLWNCAHPANRRLTLSILNSWRGLDLHQFKWLNDDEIGALPPEWNWLVGHSDPGIDPAIVHYTEGLPNIPGYERVAYAEDWKMFTNSYAQVAGRTR